MDDEDKTDEENKLGESEDFADFEKRVMSGEDDKTSDDNTTDDDSEDVDSDTDNSGEEDDEDASKEEDEAGAEDTDDPEDEDADDENEDDEGDEGDDPEDEDGEEDKATKSKKKKTVQQRIAELTKKRRAAERATAEAEEKLAESEAKNKELEAQKTKSEELAPDPNDDKYRYGEVDEQYLEDVAEYKADKKFAERQQESAKKEGEKKAAERTAYFQGKMKDFETAGVTKYDDFEDTLALVESGEVPLTFTVAELMLESKHGPDVVHALASDPTEAIRISQLSPMRQAAEFGRLEAQFSTPASSSAKKGKKKSKAPTPPKRRSRGKGGKFAPDGSTTDFAAFEKLANSRD